MKKPCDYLLVIWQTTSAICPCPHCLLEATKTFRNCNFCKLRDVSKKFGCPCRCFFSQLAELAADQIWQNDRDNFWLLHSLQHLKTKAQKISNLSGSAAWGNPRVTVDSLTIVSWTTKMWVHQWLKQPQNNLAIAQFFWSPFSHFTIG